MCVTLSKGSTTSFTVTLDRYLVLQWCKTQLDSMYIMSVAVEKKYVAISYSSLEMQEAQSDPIMRMGNGNQSIRTEWGEKNQTNNSKVCVKKNVFFFLLVVVFPLLFFLHICSYSIFFASPFL